MKTIRRFASGIFASVDWLADQVENHEALVSSAIRDVEKSTARARVQFKRVQLDGRRMRTQLEELRQKEEAWQERARKIAETDREKALECVRRCRRVQQRLKDLEEQERQHAATEKILAQDLVKLDEQLHKLKQKQNILRTRESQAQAISSISREDSALFDNIDDIFDRWESTVTAQELRVEVSSESIDFLELDFEDAEEEAVLAEELERLLNA